MELKIYYEETKAIDEYIQEALQQGFICPFIPHASDIFSDA